MSVRQTIQCDKGTVRFCHTHIRMQVTGFTQDKVTEMHRPLVTALVTPMQGSEEVNYG